MIRPFIALALLASVSAAAQTPVTVVLDTSEATNRSVGQNTIHDWVSEAIVTVVAEAGTRGDDPGIGLRTAGGGGEETTPCLATELVIPIGEPDPHHWSATLAAIDPGGLRPLNRAVIEAIGDLAAFERPSRIVIVTAGTDDCGLELREIGAALASSAHPVAIAIIGLGLGSDDLETFGEVSLRNVGSADELLVALQWAVIGDGAPVKPAVGSDASPAAPAASLVGPPEVGTGASFELEWTGPEGAEDFLSLALPGSADGAYVDWARVDDGNPAVLRAPMAAGDYELRYVDGETGAVLASAAIHVNAVTAGLEVPKHAVVGRRFEVVWQGPAADGDFIAVCKPGMPAHRYLDWAATTVGSPVSLAAPDKPGRYEVRYVAERGREVLAVTSIEIRP